MIGIREEATVRLEIEFRVLAGEIGILEQNSLDLPLEKVITIWSDQIVGSRLMILLHKLEGSNHENSKRRGRKGMGPGGVGVEGARGGRPTETKT